MASSFFFMGFMEMMMMGLMGGGQGLPLPVGLPPTAEDVKLAHVAPAEAPLFYITWAGTAKADANSTNHAEKILADPQVQHLIKSIEEGIHGVIDQETKNNPQEALLGKNIPLLIKNSLFNPATIYVEKIEFQAPAGNGGPPKVIVEAGFVVNMGKDIDDAKKAMDALEGLLVQETGQKMKILPAEQGGLRQFALPPDAPSVAWGVEGNYLIFAIGDNNIKRIRGALKNGATPRWLTVARSKISVPRTSSFTYVNAKVAIDKVVPMFGMMVGMEVGPGRRGGPGGGPAGGGPDPMAMYKKVTTALGLDKMTDVVAATGFDDDGFVSKTLVGVSPEAGGLFKLAEGKPLTAADLVDVPVDADIAYVGRVDASKIWGELLTVIAAIDPNAVTEFKREITRAEEELGFKIKDDLIDSLGDTISVYNSPSEGGLVFTGLTGVVKLKDNKKAQKVVDQLAKMLNQELNGNNNPNRFRPRKYEFKKFDFMGETIHFINPIGDDWVVAPAWSITKDRFVIAPFPQMIKAHIARKATNGASLAEQPKVKTILAASQAPITISYVDMKTVFPKVYAAMHPLMTMGLAELQSEGFKVDMSALPSASAFTKHLDKSTGFSSRTKQGIYIENRGRLPIGGMGSVAPLLMVGMTMPMMAYRNAAMDHAVAVDHAHDHGSGRTTVPTPRAAPSEAALRTQSMNQLRQIGVNVFLYHGQKGKTPDALSDLGEKATKLATDPWGQPYIYLGKDQTPAGANSAKTPLAATSHLVSGKRLVVYADGHVELIDDAKFKAQCVAAKIAYPKPKELPTSSNPGPRDGGNDGHDDIKSSRDDIRSSPERAVPTRPVRPLPVERATPR